MAETLVSFSSATAGASSTAAFWGGGNGLLLVRLGDGVEHPVGS